MGLILKDLKPILKINGDTQTFEYNEDSLVSNLARFVIENRFKSTTAMSSQSSFEFVDGLMKGFKFNHQKLSTQEYGTFALQAYSKYGITKDIFKYDEQTDTLNFLTNTNLSGGLPIIDKTYVDTGNANTLSSAKIYTDAKMWTSTQITDFDTQVRKNTLNQITKPTADLDINGIKLINVADGKDDKDAVNLGQLKELGLSNLTTNGFITRTDANTYVNRKITSGSSNLTITNGEGTNADPVIDLSVSPVVDSITIKNSPNSLTDGTNKAYVEFFVSALSNKKICKYATTSFLNSMGGDQNTISLNGIPYIIDGFSIAVGDRILVKNQNSPWMDGIYVVTQPYIDAFVLVRTTDYDSIEKIHSGSVVEVEYGTVNANTNWIQSYKVDQIMGNYLTFELFNYRIPTFLKASNNLSDVTNPVLARENLGISAQDNRILSDAEAYTDTKCTDHLQQSNAYADSRDVVNLTLAQTYTDSKTWAASQVTDFDTQVRKSTLNQITKPTADLDINSKKLINVSDPINPQDVATKSFVTNTTNTTVKSIMQGYVTTGYSTNLYHIKFDATSFVMGTSITLDKTTPYTDSLNVASVGRITLAAGKTYKLTGSLNNAVCTTYGGFRWRNADTGSFIGFAAGGASINAAIDRVPCSIAISYITTTVSTRVVLCSSWGIINRINGNEDAIGPAWFIVEEI